MDEIKNYPPYLDYPKPYKPQTNADRIRAMSDEELVEMLDYELGCPATENCEKMNCDCYTCWLNWLRRAVEGE